MTHIQIKDGGFLPILLASLGALDSWAAGASATANAVNNKKSI